MTWKLAALEHAKREDPKEACGLVVIVKGRKKYWACENLASNNEHFILSPEDYAKAEDTGEIYAVVHSHPITPAIPSQADLCAIEKGGLPWYIVNPKTGTWSTKLVPSGFKAPLLGREWVWGLCDCWSLVREWYATQGLNLPDWERPVTPEEFEAHPLFDQYWRAAGFYELHEDEALSAGDALLMNINGSGLNHVGVYIGDQMVLQHLRGRLSSRDLYGGYWMKATGKRLRHPDFTTMTKG